MQPNTFSILHIYSHRSGQNTFNEIIQWSTPNRFLVDQHKTQIACQEVSEFKSTQSTETNILALGFHTTCISLKDFKLLNLFAVRGLNIHFILTKSNLYFSLFKVF